MRILDVKRFGTMRGAWLLPALVCLTGCGTAEYEQKLDVAVKRLKIENRFVGLEPGETLLAAIKNEQGTGAKISFRKPTVFGGPANTLDSANPRQPTEKLNPERVKPPQLMNFPGFQFSYEQRMAGQGLSLAYSYYGAQPTDAGVAQRIIDDLQAAIVAADKTATPPPPPSWSNVLIDQPDGTTRQWKMLSTTGSNTFWQEGSAIADYGGGTFIIWMLEDRGFQVFLSLRATNLNANLDEMKKLMTAAVGTVKVTTPVKID